MGSSYSLLHYVSPMSIKQPNQKQNVISKYPGGRKSSFGNVKIQPITIRLPEELVRKFNILVSQKFSRLNTEVAAAMRLYMQDQAKRGKNK